MKTKLPRIRLPVKNPLKCMSIIVFLGLMVTPLKAQIALDFDAVRHAVLEGIRQNEDRFFCGVLHWELHTSEDEYIPGRKLNRQGDFSLFWDGEKVATRYLQDLVTPVGDKGEVTVARGGERKSFDGKEFREVSNVENPKSIAISYKVRFRAYENYFETSGWYEKNTFHSDFSNPQKSDWIKFEAFSITKDDLELIKVNGTNTKDGAKIVWYFDPQKSNCLVLEEWYDPQGRLYVEKTFSYQEVSGGAWFPTEIDSKSIDVDTQKLQLHHHFALDMEKSSFNDPSRISEDVFHIPITPDMEISDYRGGVRINYKRDVTPIAAKTLVEMADEFMSDKPVYEMTEKSKPVEDTVISSAEEPGPDETVVQIRPPVSDPLPATSKYAEIKNLLSFLAVISAAALALGFYWARRRKQRTA